MRRLAVFGVVPISEAWGHADAKFAIVFVEDANAALTDAAHKGTLDNMAALFADVVSTRELVENLA